VMGQLSAGRVEELDRAVKIALGLE
jgi:hypothetical protein